MSIEIQEAMSVIKQAMIDDNPSERGSLAHGWHCNIAMACQDAINSADITAFDYNSGLMSEADAHKVGNEAASRFMKILFDVDTKN